MNCIKTAINNLRFLIKKAIVFYRLSIESIVTVCSSGAYNNVGSCTTCTAGGLTQINYLGYYWPGDDSRYTWNAGNYIILAS